jgi:tripartite-type tricarboxylate transporter receptor subunit TctC
MHHLTQSLARAPNAASARLGLLLRQGLRAGTAVLLSLGFCMGVQAQGAYPTKPIQMIIPFPAGGPTEMLGRSFAQVMDTKLGQRVVVTNRDGASTTVGMHALLAAPADGYTIVYGPVTSLTVHLHWMKGLQFKADSFTPICQTFENMFLLATRPDSRFTSFQQLVAEGKAEPGKLSYGHPGISSSPHLAGAELFQNAGVTARDVAFRGEPPMLPTLMSGELDLVVVTTSFVNSQRLRPLAAFSDKRLAQFPNTPTVKELGYTVNPSGYGGLFVRSDTPRDIVTRLERACRDTVADPAFQEVAQRLFQQTEYLDHAAFQARIQADSKSKQELLKSVKLER